MSPRMLFSSAKRDISFVREKVASSRLSRRGYWIYKAERAICDFNFDWSRARRDKLKTNSDKIDNETKIRGILSPFAGALLSSISEKWGGGKTRTTRFRDSAWRLMKLAKCIAFFRRATAESLVMRLSRSGDARNTLEQYSGKWREAIFPSRGAGVQVRFLFSKERPRGVNVAIKFFSASIRLKNIASSRKGSFFAQERDFVRGFMESVGALWMGQHSTRFGLELKFSSAN